MSMTFTKLFSSITESTVWMEPDHVRIVWITMLAMCDRNGRVWASVPGLANRARVEPEACREAIAKFLGPDPDSRTPDNEGRRIEPIDGGWRLLNHKKYREIRDEEAVKEAKRRYINTRRAKERVENDSTVDQSRTASNGVEQGRAIADAEIRGRNQRQSTDSEAAPSPIAPKQARTRREHFSPPTPEEADAYAKELGMSPERRIDFLDHYTSNGWMVGKNPMKDWKATMRRWHRDPNGYSKKFDESARAMQPPQNAWQEADQGPLWLQTQG